MARKDRNNYKFRDSLELNNATFMDYCNRFRRIALSMFEWINLPKTMNARYLELCLYYNGKAALLKDKKYGFINTKCAGTGYVNIYGLPTKLNCYSYSFNSQRDLYIGLNPFEDEKEREEKETEQCILVQNNWERLPTARFNGIVCITPL